MRARLPTCLCRLRGDERGASIIEFALFAPILGFMVMGISDLAMGYSAKLELEGAAYRALEKVAVGSVQSNYSSLRQEAATAAGVPLANVTVSNWLECNRVRQSDFNGTCPDGQMVSRYVQVAITSSYQPSFDYGPIGRSFGERSADGSFPLSATAAMRVQ